MGCKCPYTLRDSLIESGVPEDEAIVESWMAYFMSDEEYEKYPWNKCVSDMAKKYGSVEKARRVCGKIKASRKQAEAASQACISAKIKIIKHHDPDMKNDQAYAYAKNFCEKHGNNPNA